jgi:hypothetical protein
MFQGHGATQNHSVRTGQEVRSVVELSDQWRIGSIAEADIEEHLQWYFPFNAFDDANNITSAAHRHEIDDANHAAVAYQFGLKDHRVVPIPLPRLPNVDGRPQGPSAVLVIAHEGRKAGVRIETRGQSMDPLRETSALV